MIAVTIQSRRNSLSDEVDPSRPSRFGFLHDWDCGWLNRVGVWEIVLPESEEGAQSKSSDEPDGQISASLRIPFDPRWRNSLNAEKCPEYSQRTTAVAP